MFFVIRHKDNLQFTSIKENELPGIRHQHILKDEIIELKAENTKSKYPKQLRRIAVWNEEHKITIELITSNLK